MIRVRKARRSSRVSCGHYVLTGELIANRADAWICLDCAILAMRAANDAPGAEQ